MATKKKTEVVEEEVQQVEAVEETPKKTTKKSTSKKKAEVVEDAPAAEEVAVDTPKAEEKPEPKKAEKKVEKKVEAPFTVVITAGNGVYSFKGPGLSFPRCRTIANGTKVTISEVKGSWGKIGDDSWILLGTTSVRI